MKPLAGVLLGMMIVGMIGCAHQSAPAPNSAPQVPDNYSLLSYRLQFTTLLNNDTAAINRCTVEELRTGDDRGPICQQACVTGDKLLEFERNNTALMKYDHDAPDEQHKWCHQVQPEKP